MSATLPDNTGFVAAAYVVFVALLLVYVVVMSIRASRLERELQALLSEGEPTEGEPAAVAVDEAVAVSGEATEGGR